MVKLETGSVVWSKLANYPYWPSRITKLSDVKPKSTREQLSLHEPEDEELVWFFGSHNYSWIPKSQIFDFDKEYEEFSKNKRAPKSFQIALREASRWIARGNKPSESEEESEEESPSESESDVPAKKPRTRKKLVKTRKQPARRGKRKALTSLSSDSESEKEEKEEKQELLPKRRTRGRRKSIKPEETPTKTVSPTTRRTRSSTLQENNNEINKSSKASSITNSPSSSNEENTDNQKKDTKITKSVTEKIENSALHYKKKLTPEGVAHIVASVMKHPVSKYHKLSVITYGDGLAETKATFSDARANSKVEVHSCVGATYHLLDLTCLIAAVTSLNEDESAITQDIHSTVLTPIPQGSEIILKAKVQQIKRPLIFVDCEVFLHDKLAITGRVIKSTAEPFVTMNTPNGKS